jgi:hypothetical protein
LAAKNAYLHELIESIVASEEAHREQMNMAEEEYEK